MDVAVASVVALLVMPVGGLELEVFAILGFGISQKGMPEKVPDRSPLASHLVADRTPVIARHSEHACLWENSGNFAFLASPLALLARVLFAALESWQVVGNMQEDLGVLVQLEVAARSFVEIGVAE